MAQSSHYSSNIRYHKVSLGSGFMAVVYSHVLLTENDLLAQRCLARELVHAVQPCKFKEQTKVEEGR